MLLVFEQYCELALVTLRANAPGGSDPKESFWMIYVDECIVGHTRGSRVHSEYSDDYMFETRMRMFEDLPPRNARRREREMLKRQLIEQLGRDHVRRVFSKSIRAGTRHQLTILRIPTISFGRTIGQPSFEPAFPSCEIGSVGKRRNHE